MNIIKFANLISSISTMFDTVMNEQMIVEVVGKIENIIECERTAPPKCNLYPLFDALAAGKKIDAIKAYRELTGEGLLESKNAIERLQMTK